MKKKFLVVFLTIISTLALAFGLTACGETGGGEGGGEEQHTHNYVPHTVSPTCTEEGYTLYECSCGDSYRADAVEALGHNLIHKSAQEATCSHVGSSEYEYCTRCDYHTEYTETPKLPHTEVVDEAVEATCTSTGLTEGKHCSVCKEVIVAQQVIGKLAHTIVVDEAVEASCTHTGLTEGSHCSVCNSVIVAQEVVPLTAHKYDADGRCEVCSQVNPDLRVSSLEISNESFLVSEGGQIQVEFTTYPSNAIYNKVSYRIFQNNTCEATLSDTGLLTCNKVGSVTIAVTIDEEITARATFYVPKMITTAEEVYNIRNDLGGVYMLANDIDLSGYSAWTPIGYATKSSSGNYDYTNAFSGKFDGGGYTISGLNINLADSSCSSMLTVGLFGSLSRDGQVSNVVLKDVTVSGASSATDYVGMLVGFNPGCVDSCTADGSVTISGATYIGGILGENIGSVKCVTANAVITITGSKNYFVGGIVGRTTGGQLSDVTVTGSVDVTSSASVYVGGVAGNLVDKLTTASADVDITVVSTDSSSYNYVGIIAGASSQLLSNITVDGSVVVECSGGSYVGGIVGYSDSGINNCTNNASILLTVTNSSTSKSSYMGGIIGKTSKDITGAINNGTVYTNQFYGGYIGGIAGSVGNISECENNNIVHVKSSNSTVYCGGVAGRAEGAISDCINKEKGVLTNEYLSSVSGSSYNQYFGGIAGSCKGSVKNSSNYANISVTTYNFVYCGGVVGYAEGNIENVHNYSSKVIVTSSVSSSSSNSNYVGGVAGYSAAISGSTNYAELSLSSKADLACGGVVGNVKGNISDVKNYAYSLTVTSSSSAVSSGKNYVGGIAGCVSGSLDNAYNMATLSVAKDNVCVGGVAGNVDGTTNSAQSTANITVKNTIASDSKYTFVGGVLGNANSSVSNSIATNSFIEVDSKNIVEVGGVVGSCYSYFKEVAISQSYAYPDITVANCYNAYVGGVCGYADSIIKSYSTSNIECTTLGSYDLYMGGLAGYLRDNAEECYATGDMSGSSSSKVYMAGLIGFVNNGATVNNCYVANGYIKTNSSSFSASSTVTVYNGGLVAYNNGSVSNCYAVNYSYSVSNGSSNQHKHYVGGLVGYNGGTVSFSYVLDATEKLARTGLEINRDVVGSGSANSFYAGGFVGYNNGTISNSYSDATVNTTVSGAYTGGFAGYNNKTISYSVAYGEVNSGIAGDTTGGFAGGGESGYSSCFFSKDSTLQTTAVGSSVISGTTASTNAELRTLSTFSSFSTTYWNIVDGKYPTLIFGSEWESRSDGFNKYNMLVNVPNGSSQYQFPHESRVTISLESNGGEEVEDILTSKGNTVVLPSISDYQVDDVKYIFIGWTTDSECLNLLDSNIVEVTETKTYYAYYCQVIAKPEAVSHVYTGSEISVAETYKDTDSFTVSGTFVGTNVGEYKIVVKLNHGYCWSNGSVDDYEIVWTITTYVVEIPNIYYSSNYVLFADETRDLATEFGSELYTTSGDTTVSRLDEDKHTLTFTLKDTENYAWSDSSTTEKSFDYYVVTGVCGTNGSSVAYRLSDGTLTVIGEGAMASYSSGTAPWYDKRGEIINIDISNGVTSIGAYAFYECSYLISATIGKSIISISSNAFSGCYKLIEIKNLSSLNIIAGSNNYGYVANYAKRVYSEGESYLSSDANGYIIYSDGIDKILVAYTGEKTDLVLPSCITQIYKYAFNEYSGLTSVTIPDSVTSIRSYAFYNCTNLTEIKYNATECADLSSGNYVFYKAGQSGDGITVTIGANVKKIPAYLFYPYSSNAPKITSVVFEDGSICESIGEYAFCYCSSLTSVNIPDSVTSIGSSAFSGCSSLTSITIPDSVTSIEYGAFSGCSSLTSITIPNDVTCIGGYAFYGCSDLISIVIPNSVENIGIAAFKNCNSLTSIIIGNSVTSLGSSAFENCSSLMNVTMGDSGKLTSIGDGAFYNCRGIKNITIPDSVTSIGSSALSGCSSLESMTIPFVGAKAGVTSKDTYQYPFGYIFGTPSYIGGTATTQCYYANSISSTTNITYYIPSSLEEVIITGGNILYGAFYNCRSLTNITIPDSVTSIGEFAFYNCSNLESITIPDSVTSIGINAFSGSSSLKSISIPFVGAKSGVTSSNTYQYPFGYIFGTTNYDGGIATKQYYYGGSAGSVTNTTYYIPSSLKEVTVTGGNILYGAFYGCSGLTNVTIGNNVTSIGSKSFFRCNSLNSVTIGDGVTKIDSDAFYYCSSLTNVMIGEDSKLTSIGNSAFYNCSSITNITIPDSVISIGSSSFSGCSNMTSITIGNSVTSIGDSAFYNCSSITNITIPDSVISIGSSSFSGCSNMTSITIGNSVTSIGNYAFYNCISLVGELVIPDSVTSIGDNAFRFCSSLTSITIPNSVKGIGSSAFSGCSSLESIIIPFIGAKANVTSRDTFQYPFGYIFGTTSYDGGTATTQYFYGGSTSSTTNETYYIPSSLKNVIVTGGNILLGAFGGCGGLTSITIPDNVTSIGKGAFSGCKSLTSITIPDNVTSIGYEAFSGCSSLTSVYVMDMVSWCNIEFVGPEANPLFYAHNLYLNNKLVTELVISDSIIRISDYVFYGCSSLKNVNIPESVTSIGDCSFYNCISMMSITMLGRVTSIGYSAFRYCSSLTNVNIPESVTNIGDYAFDGCGSLTSIIIPDRITSIGERVFSSCKSLTDLNIPNSVTSIGSSAFSGCSSLTSVNIPNSVTSIGSSAFSGCSSLTSITIPFVGAVAGKTASDTYQYPFGYIFGTSSYTGGTETLQFYYGSSTSSTTGTTYYIPTSLKNVIITGGNILYGAFDRCSHLITVTICSGVTSISCRAFYYCSSLTSVTFENVSGWKVSTDISFSSYISLSSSSLANTSTAVTYLRSTYFSYYWKRS
ncbi:MAG: leucine-rich repeat protein [Candidatus Coproplasma sp.]